MTVARSTTSLLESRRYLVPAEPPAEALRLHCNEGACPPFDIAPVDVARALARRYPKLDALRREIASRVGCDAENVVVGSGGDDVIDRVMRAFAGHGKRVVVLDPTFEMIPTYALQTGASVSRVAWEDDFPIDEVIDASRGADVLALVTPDNPTGRVIALPDVLRCAMELPQTLLLLDHAYVEYAAQDYTAAVAGFPNVVVVRTFSKAWGLAGLRVGYGIAPVEVAERLRAVGSPYPVSGLSADLAIRCLRSPAYVSEHVDRVAVEREALSDLIGTLGGTPWRSEANFVCARFPRAQFVYRALGALGVTVRDLTSRAGLEDVLRVSCPGSVPDFDRLCGALRTALAPDALLFDMDGVLADVRGSYRAAITRTCADFGVRITDEEIAALKQAGGANDDFELTWRLVRQRGVVVQLTAVTECFQRHYDGGLWREERLLVDREILDDLARRFRLAVVTGRPRVEAERFLASNGLRDTFLAVVCREDGPLKPSPSGVRRAMAQLRAETGWMFGDTIDDIVAAREGGVLPIGVAAPNEFTNATQDALAAAGAAATWSNLTEVVKWL